MPNYNNIICIHPVDETTDFLRPLGLIFADNYIVVSGDRESHDKIFHLLNNLTERSLIIFLGHGSSTMLKGASCKDYQQENFIDVKQANSLFKSHDVFLLSCHSAEFLATLDSFNSCLGFGNILSSEEEVELEQRFRDINLNTGEIEIFKSSFLRAVQQAFICFLKDEMIFNDLSFLIIYFINKEINQVLSNKDFVNRREIAKLLFEFRDEMVIIKK